MSRKTRTWRLASPSISQRNRENAFYKGLAQQLGNQLATLEYTLMRVIKAEGSNLIPGRFALCLFDDPTKDPGEGEALTIERGDGFVTIVVQPKVLEDPGVAEQVAAFTDELAQAATPAPQA